MRSQRTRVETVREDGPLWSRGTGDRSIVEHVRVLVDRRVLRLIRVDLRRQLLAEFYDLLLGIRTAKEDALRTRSSLVRWLRTYLTSCVFSSLTRSVGSASLPREWTCTPPCAWVS